MECRQDWYQTQTTVILSVFAKNVDKENTNVKFFSDEIHVDARFKDGKTYTWHSPLSQPIHPEASKFTILSTKIEIILAKANGISWASIEPRENLLSFTTFGVTGKGGTIGSKEAIIANDAPIHLLKKN